MKDTDLETETPQHQVYQEYVMNPHFVHVISRTPQISHGVVSGDS